MIVNARIERSSGIQKNLKFLFISSILITLVVLVALVFKRVSDIQRCVVQYCNCTCCNTSIIETANSTNTPPPSEGTGEDYDYGLWPFH